MCCVARPAPIAGVMTRRIAPSEEMADAEGGITVSPGRHNESSCDALFVLTLRMRFTAVPAPDTTAIDVTAAHVPALAPEPPAGQRRQQAREA